MKREKRLLTKIETLQNLELAFWKASKGKRYSSSVLLYQNILYENLELLQQQIKTGNIEVGNYQYFTVFEPKRREICSSAFSEQVLHHALLNVCHSVFDRKQMDESYASRKGKGTYKALEKAQMNCRKFEWFLKLDIKKYFASIHHDVLKSQLFKLFKEERLLCIFFEIIDSFSDTPNRGLPIGNLTSQNFANHYLNAADRYCKQGFGAPAYTRYMDDMVIWANTKEDLLHYRDSLQAFIEKELRLSLNPCLLNHTKHGLPFLGYKVFPYQLHLLHKSKHRYIRKMRASHTKFHTLVLNEQQTAYQQAALASFAAHAQSLSFRNSVETKINGQIP